MKTHTKYHIKVEGKRTTVSINTTMDDLLSIKLGEQPQTKAAHTTIRKFIQSYVDHDPGAFISGASNRIQKMVLLEIVDNILSRKYHDWLAQVFDNYSQSLP